MTAAVAAALNAAAIPVSKAGRARHARLRLRAPSLLLDLRRFATTGHPSAAETGAAAERFGLAPDEALRALSAEDLVHTDQDGEVVVAYPFSGRATEHLVRFEGGHEVHAMCSIDARGIAPMFGESIEIVSRDPLASDTIVVRLDAAGAGRWQPEEAVVVCGASGGGDSCNGCCPVLNFFASAEHGERWLQGRLDVRGHIMTMHEAIEAGRTVFGDMLSPTLAQDVDAELPSAR